MDNYYKSVNGKYRWMRHDILALLQLELTYTLDNFRFVKNIERHCERTFPPKINRYIVEQYGNFLYDTEISDDEFGKNE